MGKRPDRTTPNEYADAPVGRETPSLARWRNLPPRSARSGFSMKRPQLSGLSRGLVSLPNLVWVLLFFLVPSALMILYSFATQDTLTAKISFGWTLESYERFNDSIILQALVRSLWISGAATFICLLMAYPLAYFLAFRAGRLKPYLVTLVIIPFLTSFVIRTYAWVGILDTNGILNDALLSLGVLDRPLDLLFSPSAIIIGIVYNYLPLMVLTLFVVLDRIHPHVLEAARDLGASSISTFRRVVYPQGLPGMIAGIIVVGAPATGEYVIPTILGGGKTLMYGNVIANQFGRSFEWPYGAALSVILVGLLLAAIGLCIRVAGRIELERMPL
ncbi:ABC transporter permease [Mesorhizobium sp. M1A.F.Ca.IN.022.05.2.1]|nr:ABC transporter permease [Mesorhizobium sp. M1A.F.Ca.IN.020.32.1.1]RUW10410.1 ABC transporter permease [Mesorhizobium sp. M1A.F.Ca.IN.022.05.2.1]RWF82734.1 MAG: ABC transporter permease [Mesorhizobium sp.]RWF97853.1 MAG: ABC transporter permease [Mesorhizobium sp.]RWG88360.1 MAG: ABC transporter permease [Mesorhizobium sp.]